MPDIKWIGSPNFHQGRHGYKVLAIVDHIMTGTENGTDTWFQNPKSQVSAHYGVGKDGSIHQYVKDEDEAWAVGNVNKPDWPLYNGGVNPNYYTVSIEHEGYPQDGLTEPQYQSTLWLHLQLVGKFNIPVDADHIIGHNRLDTVNRASCPGAKFPWDRLFTDLKAALNPAPPDIHSGYDEFYDDVDWAYNNGILLKHSDGTFKPQEGITREQFAHGLRQFFIQLQKGAIK